ncbi:hypothetical protein [Sorangium sp. So ce1153]|uniref:hypothetical protein n=1 Tax=Sorangium sp. So ce1153 TaxID=3133333 RepID=UPI003F5E409C
MHGAFALCVWKSRQVRCFSACCTLLPAWRANPVGLDDVLEGFCPPDYKNMSEAADALLEEKCGKGDTYGDPADFERAYETLDIAQRFLNEVPRYRTPAWPSARPPVFNLKGNY